MLRTIIAVIVAVFTLSFSSSAKAFEEYPTFEEYALQEVSVLQTLAKPVLKKRSVAYKFRTRINECAQDGVNFAGKYTLCSIGQGTDVQINFLIDRRNGNVRRIEGSELGVETHPASNLLIINPDPSVYYTWPEVPQWLSIRYYALNVDTGELAFLQELKP